MHQPGEHWLYNTGSDVLGVLIARASGQPLETFLRERIFEPLGMKDTGFSVPAAKLDRLATSYCDRLRDRGARASTTRPGGQWSRPPAFPDGGGGLVSTVDDYLAFGRMLLNQGRHGERAHPVAALGRADDDRSAHARAEGGLRPIRRLGQSRLGLRRRRSSPGATTPAVPGRYGWDGGFGTSWHRIPRRRWSRILMTQRALPAALAGLSRFLDLGLPGDRRLTAIEETRRGERLCVS